MYLSLQNVNRVDHLNVWEIHFTCVGYTDRLHGDSYCCVKLWAFATKWSWPTGNVFCREWGKQRSSTQGFMFQQLCCRRVWCITAAKDEGARFFLNVRSVEAFTQLTSVAVICVHSGKQANLWAGGTSQYGWSSSLQLTVLQLHWLHVLQIEVTGLTSNG
jgi:hypothetical protein